MSKFAAGFGVPITQPDLIPNTRRALAATELARDQGRLPSFRDAIMEAHWVEGANIESDDTLARIATKVGLDPGAVIAAATDQTLLARIDAQRKEANERGVHGIPTFFFGNLKIVGCQPYETLEAQAEKAGLKRRARGGQSES